MNIEFVVYRPNQIIPSLVISQLQKIHLATGMMWPCFMQYKDDPQSKLILSVAFVDGVARSWTIIFSRFFWGTAGIKQMGKDRYIHSYTQKAFRNKGLNRKCVENAIKLNSAFDLQDPMPEGSYDYWKHIKLPEPSEEKQKLIDIEISEFCKQLTTE